MVGFFTRLQSAGPNRVTDCNGMPFRSICYALVAKQIQAPVSEEVGSLFRRAFFCFFKETWSRGR